MSRLLSRSAPSTSIRGDVEDALAANRSRRNQLGATGSVTGDQAMRLSVAWACRRLRADLVSTMPIDTYRRAAGVQIEVPKPPVMVTPGGDDCLWIEWLASSQMDLDGYGNTFGVIEERDATGRPAVIRLVSASSAAVKSVKVGTGSAARSVLRYRFGSQEYDRADVWHEKQHVVPGLPVGLSPIAHAALTMNASISAAEYANAWFGNGAAPSSHLKNTAKTLNPAESARTKRRLRATIEAGDVFVSGKDWTWEMLSAKASESTYLEQQRATNLDLCRYLGTPGDVVDVGVDGSATINYANITQRNLQFLIMHLNPALIRRESVFSHFWMPAPRYAKFNRGALLQMDPKTRAETMKIRIDSRTLDVDEARALEDLPPLNDEQIARFGALFGNKNTAPPSPALPGGSS